MTYTELSAKQKRIVEKDLQTLFSQRAIQKAPTTAEDLKRIIFSYPEIKYKRGTLFLSEDGKNAVERLVKIFSGMTPFDGMVSKQELHSIIIENYQTWLNRDLQPSGKEFTEKIVSSIISIIKDYGFLVKLEGFDLRDQDSLDLCSFCIQRSNPQLLENIKFEGNLDFETIYKEFKNCIWLIGRSRGSPDVAGDQFDLKALLASGVIGIFGAILYDGAIWRTCVRPITSPNEYRNAVSGLRWEVGGLNPSYSRKFGDLNLPIDSNQIAYLTKNCFLEELVLLLDKKPCSELENAILRAIYWFADAYRDRNPTMQFIKLWSCIECFFAIEDRQIKELNARGIATVLTFAGYRIISLDEYSQFKKRIEGLYDLRSRALHQGWYQHIGLLDLNNLSRWIAWLVISMVALADRGYTSLRAVYDQTERLDVLSRGK